MSSLEQESLESSVENYLKSMLEYVKSNLDVEGVTWRYGEKNMIKATARLGLLAGYVHLGLGDSESLSIFNKIARALHSHLKSAEMGVEDRYEILLTQQALLDLAVLHYGLTGSEGSREILMNSCVSLVKEFGWTPVTSCSTYLLYSAHTSIIAGGKPNKQDIEIALEEISDKFTEFVNYTSRRRENLALGLQILSIALNVALSSKTQLPLEVPALWEVHLNYTLNYIKESSEELDYESYELFLNSFITSLETGYGSSLRDEVLRESEKIAVKLMENWISGGRLILQEKDSFNYLLLDPSLDFNQLMETYNRSPRIRMYDLNLPLLLQRLSKIEGIEKADEFQDGSTLAVKTVSSSQPYFKVVRDEISPHQEIIDRILSTSFLSSWYVIEKAEKRPPQEIEFAYSGPSYYTLISSSAILIILLILYRLGRLIKVEGE
ncbi:MAG: hypothetical protein NZ929_04640 [Aigarchaeota archaeon]|nr:hypothetical protein [Aigarchaeota archaeon]MCX8193556.1 hypothetical protein [Nitrososphaeria archaeon]MDW7986696.1 hypothetical protein [Nitrososphaerota archaeon]